MLQKEIEFNDNNQALAQSADTHWITDGLTLNLMFTNNSAALSDNDHANIKQLSNVLLKFPHLNLQLDGYSDPVGSQSDNLLLSQNRVNSVKQAFEYLGVDSNRILSSAHGEAQGFSTNDSKDTLAMARKVSLNFVQQNDGELAQN